MFKWLIRILIIGGVLFVVVTLAVQYFDKQGKEPPPVSAAKYVVTTASRTYYTDSYEWQGNTLILHSYWSTLRDKWVLDKKDLELSQAFGKRQIARRQVQK